MDFKFENEKETFINILSHDLRTPLIAQVQSLKMLIEGEFGILNTQQLEMLQLTRESCRELLSMVSDVLTNYKIESNEIRFNFENLYVQKIIEEVCVDLDMDLSQKGLQVEIYPAAKDITVKADLIFLKQAFKNIAANCISYADKNTIIRVILHKTERNLCISLITKGKPLSQDVLKCLFDYNSRNSLTHTKIGFGMKLNLALNIIKAHSGGIVARNGAQGEIVFDIILPFNKSGLPITPLDKSIKIA